MTEIILQNGNVTTEPLVDKVCENCGSNDISFEGFIRWSVEHQWFEVDDICYKGHYCGNCSSECHFDDVEVTQ